MQSVSSTSRSSAPKAPPSRSPSSSPLIDPFSSSFAPSSSSSHQSRSHPSSRIKPGQNLVSQPAPLSKTEQASDDEFKQSQGSDEKKMESPPTGKPRKALKGKGKPKVRADQRKIKRHRTGSDSEEQEEDEKSLARPRTRPVAPPLPTTVAAATSSFSLISYLLTIASLPPHSSFPLLTPKEYNSLLSDWNHIEGRWRKTKFDKDHPWIVPSKGRAEKEKRLNPLVELLGIELIVSNSAEAEDDDSEEIGSDDSARSVDTIIPSDEDDDEGLYSSGDRRVPISKGRPKVLRKKKGDKGNEQMDGSGSKGAKAGQREKKRTKSKNERTSELKSDSGSGTDNQTKPPLKLREPVRHRLDNNSRSIGNLNGDLTSVRMKADTDLVIDDDSALPPIHPVDIKSSSELLEPETDDGDSDGVGLDTVGDGEDEDPCEKALREKEERDDKKRRRDAQEEKVPETRDAGEAGLDRALEMYPVSDVDQEMEDSTLSDQDCYVQVQTYPHTRRSVRPKFSLDSAAQEAIPPFVLSPGWQIPASINCFLRDYQREGVQFFWDQWKKGKGGILGDDMGLGKTIQVISFLSAITKSTGYRKQDSKRRKRLVDRIDDNHFPSASSYGPTCLIACPATLVINWKREIETWSYLEAVIYQGNERKNVVDRFRKGYYDIIICSLNAVRDNIQDLETLDLTVIVVDEVHKLKDVTKGFAKAFRRFPSVLRYGLTGTAIQNRLEEFRAILDWSCPGAVGTRQQWKLYVSNPIKFGQSTSSTLDESVRMRMRADALVNKLLPNFFLRREKKIIAHQMPEKTDTIVICPLTPHQLSAYKRLLQLDAVQKILTHDDPCPCGAQDHEGKVFERGKCCFQGWSTGILGFITLFRKVASHVGLIYPDRTDRADIFERDLVHIKMAFPLDYQTRMYGSMVAHDETLCGKWTVLQNLLITWRKNHDKVLIFSGSLKLLDMLKMLINGAGYSFVSLDGHVKKVEERMGIVDEFNSTDTFCFLISIMAGGTGLNITSANKVVIFDPNWNPAHDLQAMDRAFRIGQTRNVDVYRMVGAGTLEELIYNRQQHKRALAGIGYEATRERKIYAGVEGEKDKQGELFGVKNLFKLHEHIGLTERLMEQCNQEDLEWAHSGVTSLGIAEAVPEIKDDNPGERMLKEILANTTTMISDRTLGNSVAERAREKVEFEAYKKAREKARTAKAEAVPVDSDDDEVQIIDQKSSSTARPSKKKQKKVV